MFTYGKKKKRKQTFDVVDMPTPHPICCDGQCYFLNVSKVSFGILFADDNWNLFPGGFAFIIAL